MSTPNFHNKNASKIFATECQEEWDYDDSVENIRYGLEAKFAKDYTKENKSDDGLRSYPGNIIAEITSKEKIYNEFSVNVILEVIVRGGYYSGMNFDYNIKYNINGEILDDLEEFDTEVLDYLEASQKQLENYVTWTKKFLLQAEQELRSSVEEVFEMYTTPLNCIGVFSNAEAIYEVA